MDFNREIKTKIHEKFPSLSISIFMDETQDNIIVAIDNDLYYSEEYLALIMDIKINFLWKNNIFNYLFVKEAPKFFLAPGQLPNIRILHSQLSFNNNTVTKAIKYLTINYSDSSSEGEQLWPKVA